MCSRANYIVLVGLPACTMIAFEGSPKRKLALDLDAVKIEEHENL
jgi:hypothetical protein